MAAVAVLELSAWLVAVTVTVCDEYGSPGAVYRPAALIVPAFVGLIDHVTAVLAVPATLAVNCCV
jgi:hypothetical protein